MAHHLFTRARRCGSPCKLSSLQACNALAKYMWSSHSCRAVPAESAHERLWKTPHTHHCKVYQRELSPPEARGSHEDGDRHEVEAAPHGISQDLVLTQEDVSDGHHWNILFTGPGEHQSDQPTWLPIHEGWWRAQEILLGICEAKLEEVHGHEHDRHRASDGRI
eukprot:CAMPEP_0194524610 /NCGR_PEP_ID=MMETSP0253-20130528/59829_1 /TAXON_ID=2966 /ORGANISM="Noctiluca scintillans" /LENGTH=163 /DNA_ID=CAMNT_0039369255 /DNA_START=525 /DNA_END=1016 /DNA_ORIENTATION=-